MIVLPNVETLTVQMYGCRVIQKLLDFLSMEQKKIIFRKHEPRIEEYIKDHNGNHVIQKCIEVMEIEDKQIILNRYDNNMLNSPAIRTGVALSRGSWNIAQHPRLTV